jgi:hypothetical protein
VQGLAGDCTQLSSADGSDRGVTHMADSTEAFLADVLLIFRACSFTLERASRNELLAAATLERDLARAGAFWALDARILGAMSDIIVPVDEQR